MMEDEENLPSPRPLLEDTEQISSDDEFFGPLSDGSGDEMDVGPTYSSILAELKHGIPHKDEDDESKTESASFQLKVESNEGVQKDFEEETGCESNDGVKEECIKNEEEDVYFGEVRKEQEEMEEECNKSLEEELKENSLKGQKDKTFSLEGRILEFGVEEEVENRGEKNENEIDVEDLSSDTDDGNEPDESICPEEIDSLLEAGLSEDYRRRSKPSFSVKELIVLEEKGRNTLEALPEGWIEVRHSSGMPIYLQRKTRVCTLGKPYSLGPSSVRKHLIPVSGIPCLSYRRALEREQGEKAAEVEKTKTEGKVSSPNGCNNEENVPAVEELSFVPLPPAKVETAEETNTLFTIEPLELREYCQNLFRFRTIQSKRFKNWNAKRKHTKMQKRLKVQRPTLPDGVKLIKFPVKPLGSGEGGSREYVLNPKGKSSVCILHEYVQHALRQQPVYRFKELEHASTPYSATVLINGIHYGTGYGTSKKQAKGNAAKETLQVLIPQIKDSLEPQDKKLTLSSDIAYTQCFGQIELDDPRIATLCQNISEPTPYSLLLTCIQRNYGKLSDGSLQFEMVSTLGNQKIKFKMAFREHAVDIIAPNKKEGKQIASQTMLAKIHPHIKNFGAFIRLYGNDSIKSCKEKKADQQEVTELQSKAALNQPNFAILTKLREEMMKISRPEPHKDSLEFVKENRETQTDPILLLT